MPETNLDDVLEKIGKWGRFQQVYYLCLCFVVIFSVFPMSYIFTARDIKYRCLIKECEEDAQEYNPTWLKDFVPYKDKIPSRCLRYATENDTCSSENINKNKTVICQSFVYERKETTIVHDFSITCDNNLWKLTVVGTINVIGELICMSYSGFLSDRYGRSKIMIASILASTLFGSLRSFSSHYIMYLLFEILDTAFGAAMYGSAFILAIELVPHDQRNLANTLISCVFSLGQIILGLVAMISPTWRYMLRALYLPGFISIIFIWIIPESIRWLISNGQHNKAKHTLMKIAQTNKSVLHEETITDFFKGLENTENNTVENKETFRKAIMNKVLFFRVLFCSYIWISCNFIFYGLTIHSVGVSENIYISFIFTVAIEVPGYVIYYLFNEKIGRRKIMFLTLALGGISCVLVEYISDECFWGKLVAFLIGKCCLTIAYTVLYVYTTEMFPTCSRHSMFSICSMFGRLGSMIAPQIPLLTRISKSLPLLMFGILAGTSGCLSLFLPETLNTKLPDSIKEAVRIGKPNHDQEIKLTIPNFNED